MTYRIMLVAALSVLLAGCRTAPTSDWATLNLETRLKRITIPSMGVRNAEALDVIEFLVTTGTGPPPEITTSIGLGRIHTDCQPEQFQDDHPFFGEDEATPEPQSTAGLTLLLRRISALEALEAVTKAANLTYEIVGDQHSDQECQRSGDQNL